MTLTQLRAFALVAQLGSMRAAALELGISEPAVSSAIAALRTDLGDPLVVRAGSGIALTPGGRRLAAHADEIVGMADRVRREVAAAGSAHDVLHVAVTPAFAEHAADALLDAFSRRSPGTKVELQRVEPDRLLLALLARGIDLALGVRPAGAGDVTLDVVPFLRYQRVVVAAAGHALAAQTGRPVSRSELRGARWFAGPGGIEELSEEGRWLTASGLLPDMSYEATEAAALDEVRGGAGVMLALSHVVRQDLRDGTLVPLPLPGTPVAGLWCASVLGQGRSTTVARALQRFSTTPDATAAMVAVAGVPRQRRAPAVHVTLWS